VGAILLVVMAQKGYSWSVLITKNIFRSNSEQQIGKRMIKKVNAKTKKKM
jgi:hypothetical protein